MTDKPLKVAILCHSDNMGGAAVVTMRLHNALRREGVDSRMVVFTQNNPGSDVTIISNRFKRGFYFVRERFEIFMNNGMSRDNLFKVSTASCGPDIMSNAVVRNADVVVLSWVNQGMLSLNQLDRLLKSGKPVVWMMHDMWNMTGICHHALECRNYVDPGECGRCQFLSSDRPDDLSHKVWKKKNEIYRNATNLQFVAVSNWSRRKAAESSLMKDMPVETIFNPFPIDSFDTRFPEGYEPSIISHDRKVIAMGAARLDQPIKGLPYAIEALNYLFDNNPELCNNAEAVFFGDLRNPDALADLRFPHRYVGRISDPLILRRLYTRSSVVLSSSLYETLPGTLIEGQASGALAVSFGEGGQDDIIEHKKNGYIARYLDTKDLAEGIEWALSQNQDVDALHESVRERFGSEAVARRYIELFNRMLHRNG
ncbi:MAG: glycosyltransferase [Muribaculaceae bacterium]|nr:glycosyltransferase [Muribaculaceae bacterium]